ncbi:MAG: hypothetical protein IJP33_03180 [Firmicutes bacterium]|nr:hypothetical protein [Bacillota bacterium]
MTAQKEDIFLYKGEKVFFVDCSKPFGFDPRRYGIIPEYRRTDCRRGYYCIYEIMPQGIFLRELHIHCRNDACPLLQGIAAEAGEDFFVYRGLDIGISFTGRLLLGQHFLDAFYVHAGSQRAWSYQKLTELIFEKGVLVYSIDKSGLAALLRERLRQSDALDNGFFLEIEAEICEIAEKEGIREWWLPKVDKKFVQLLMTKST